MHSVLDQPGLYKELLPQQQQNKQTKNCNNYLEYETECRLQGIGKRGEWLQIKSVIKQNRKQTLQFGVSGRLRFWSRISSLETVSFS